MLEAERTGICLLLSILWEQNSAELHGWWVEEKHFHPFLVRKKKKKKKMSWRAGTSCVPPNTASVRATLLHETIPGRAVPAPRMLLSPRTQQLEPPPRAPVCELSGSRASAEPLGVCRGANRLAQRPCWAAWFPDSKLQPVSDPRTFPRCAMLNLCLMCEDPGNSLFPNN